MLPSCTSGGLPPSVTSRTDTVLVVELLACKGSAMVSGYRRLTTKTNKHVEVSNRCLCSEVRCRSQHGTGTLLSADLLKDIQVE